MSHSVNYGLWVMTCQSRFINCDKCTTLFGDMDDRGGCAWVGTKSVWEISVPSAQFCHKPKIAEKKIQSFLKKEKGEFLQWHRGFRIQEQLLRSLRRPGSNPTLMQWVKGSGNAAAAAQI